MSAKVRLGSLASRFDRSALNTNTSKCNWRNLTQS